MDSSVKINGHVARVGAQGQPRAVVNVVAESEPQSVVADEIIDVSSCGFITVYNNSGSAAAATASSTGGGTFGALTDAAGSAISVATATVQPIFVSGVKFIKFNQAVIVVKAF